MIPEAGAQAKKSRGLGIILLLIGILLGLGMGFSLAMRGDEGAVPDQESNGPSIADVLELERRVYEAELERDKLATRLEEEGPTGDALEVEDGDLRQLMTRIDQLKLELQEAKGEADMYRNGLEKAVEELNALGRQTSMPTRTSSSRPARPRSQTRPSRTATVVAYSPKAYPDSGGLNYIVEGSAKNLDDELAATGYVEIMLDRDGQQVSSARVQMTIPPLREVHYREELKSGGMTQGHSYQAVARWVDG